MEPQASGESRRLWLGAIGLWLAVVAAYWPVQYAGFIWDDDDYVVQNRTLRDVDGLRRIWSEIGATPQYYPLVHTTFWLEYHAWGLAPRGYHVVNVALHALAATLLWRCLVRLQVPGAWLAAALFALHPLNVESVAWVTERKNVLAGVLSAAALWAYLRFAGSTWQPSAPQQASAKRDWRWFGLATFLFLGALLSKTVAGTLPGVIFVLAWWKRDRWPRSELGPLALWVALAVPLGLVTIWTERSFVGAVGRDWQLGPVERFLVAGRVLWFYPCQLIWPSSPTFVYPRWEVAASSPAAYLFPAAALLLIVLLWRLRDRWGKGPLVVVLCYAGMLFPALGFFNIYPMRYSFVADHFQYFAGTALFAGAAALLAKLADRWWSGDDRRVPLAASGLLLAVLGALTAWQCRIYENLETLWTDTLDKNPACWMAHNNLGDLYLQRGDLARAESCFLRAVDLNPDYAEGISNLGNLRARQGDIPAAVRAFERALAIDPRFAVAHFNLGVAFEQLRDNTRAIDHYVKALQIQPRYLAARYNLAVLEIQLGQFEAAEQDLRAVLQVDPAHAATHNNLGTMYLHQGRLDDAVRHYEAALASDPNLEVARRNLDAVRAARRERQAAGS